MDTYKKYDSGFIFAQKVRMQKQKKNFKNMLYVQKSFFQFWCENEPTLSLINVTFHH